MKIKIVAPVNTSKVPWYRNCDMAESQTCVKNVSTNELFKTLKDRLIFFYCVFKSSLIAEVNSTGGSKISN